MSQYLSDENYALVTNSVPIVCVDMIPVRKRPDGQFEVGVITRATGSQTGKIALIGGRVYHRELLDQAMARHLQADLGVTQFDFWPGNKPERPFYVQQYQHAEQAKEPLGFDPSKHSIGLNYLITLSSQPQPANEATDFHWITRDQIPAAAAYNQQVPLAAAFDFLQG